MFQPPFVMFPFGRGHRESPNAELNRRIEELSNALVAIDRSGLEYDNSAAYKAATDPVIKQIRKALDAPTDENPANAIPLDVVARLVKNAVASQGALGGASNVLVHPLADGTLSVTAHNRWRDCLKWNMSTRQALDPVGSWLPPTFRNAPWVETPGTPPGIHKLTLTLNGRTASIRTVTEDVPVVPNSKAKKPAMRRQTRIFVCFPGIDTPEVAVEANVDFAAWQHAIEAMF